MIVPEGQDVAPESKQILSTYKSLFPSSQAISATPSSAQTTSNVVKLPDYFSNGKKIVFSKGSFCDIDKLDYYDGEFLEAVKRAILHYQCYIYSISAFPERFESSENYFSEEIDAISLCIKRGWKDRNLTSIEHIAFRLRHVNGISLIVSGLYFHSCTLTFINTQVYGARTGARGFVKTVSKTAMLHAYDLHPPEKNEEISDKLANEKHRSKLHEESLRLATDDAFIQPTGKADVCFKSLF